MENKHYSFKAKFNEVDFARIVHESAADGYDFVKVKWTNEEGQDQFCYFANLRGYARARKVNMGRMYFTKFRCNVDSAGNMVKRTCDPTIKTDYQLYLYDNLNHNWNSFISTLREREERDRVINVVQIR